MAKLFNEMTLHDLDRFLVGLGFNKIGDERKKGDPVLFSIKEGEWRLITYEHPERKENVKITIMYGAMAVESDCGKKQRTVWKKFETVEEFRQYFKL